MDEEKTFLDSFLHDHPDKLLEQIFKKFMKERVLDIPDKLLKFYIILRNFERNLKEELEHQKKISG